MAPWRCQLAMPAQRRLKNALLYIYNVLCRDALFQPLTL